MFLHPWPCSSPYVTYHGATRKITSYAKDSCSGHKQLSIYHAPGVLASLGAPSGTVICLTCHGVLIRLKVLFGSYWHQMLLLWYLLELQFQWLVSGGIRDHGVLRRSRNKLPIEFKITKIVPTNLEKKNPQKMFEMS